MRKPAQPARPAKARKAAEEVGPNGVNQQRAGQGVQVLTGPGGRPHRLQVWPRRPALVLRSIKYSSGAVAVPKDAEVQVEISQRHTVWIYNAKGVLLYTLHADDDPTKYVALMEEA